MAKDEDKKERQDDSKVTLDKVSLTEIIAAATAAGVKAANTPTAEEAANIAAEVTRKSNRRTFMRKIVRTSEQMKLKREANCRHEQPDGTPAVGGQAFSDGMNRTICLRCQKIMLEEATPEMAVARTEIQRLIEQGLVKVRPDGTIEMYENRMGGGRSATSTTIPNARNRVRPGANADDLEAAELAE